MYAERIFASLSKILSLKNFQRTTKNFSRTLKKQQNFGVRNFLRFGNKALELNYLLRKSYFYIASDIAHIHFEYNLLYQSQKIPSYSIVFLAVARNLYAAYKHPSTLEFILLTLIFNLLYALNLIIQNYVQSKIKAKTLRQIARFFI